MIAVPILLAFVNLAHLTGLDTAVIGVYFAAVLRLGFVLQRRTGTGVDFFSSAGR